MGQNHSKHLGRKTRLSGLVWFGLHSTSMQTQTVLEISAFLLILTKTSSMASFSGRDLPCIALHNCTPWQHVCVVGELQKERIRPQCRVAGEASAWHMETPAIVAAATQLLQQLPRGLQMLPSGWQGDSKEPPGQGGTQGPPLLVVEPKLGERRVSFSLPCSVSYLVLRARQMR